MRSERRGGFTLIELLVVIAIIGLLAALLLPAVQAVRESGRRTHCSNNVAQLAKAALAHETVHGFYPSGGWGFFWVGDADRGFGKTQPGGYMYSLLPFVEQTAIWSLPVDGNPNSITTPQRDGARTMVRTLLPTVNCPTRRPCQLFAKPIDGTFIANNASNNPSATDNVAARSDYAINGGHEPTSAGNLDWIDWAGPGSGINLADPWANPGNWPYLSGGRPVEMTGVAGPCSEVRATDMADGTSLTYMIGERYVNPGSYFDGMALHDCESWVQGTNNDMVRGGHMEPRPDSSGVPGVRQGWEHFPFGSNHAISFCMSFADSAVKWIRYDIDPAVHKALSNRKDGVVIPGNAIR